ncbi:MAG: 4-(cytidine 5'-diphospho)-2-C-methyl-D-erythritol kinase [Treponema sp.]|jgi:4-diphosphocytidyl-2-C-methyl-D-erythritol kinase|nr:4-(cytidine 5'-diphospho)-2-C-methyl-D-erythritol kinase [Treponema sp.]
MPKSSEFLTIAAPAKINLHLAVKDKRPDGFHNLESVFLALDFADTLHFEPLPAENAVEIDMKGFLPMEKNIVFAALSLFRGKTGYSQGLKITVEKRIPLGGGLGGGSSDAASTLLALNTLSGSLLDEDSLLETAASMGSDVPFFVRRAGAAWVTGRGENIKPVAAPRCFFVLVNPGFPSETAAAFRLLDEYRAGLTMDDNGCFEQTLLAALKSDPAGWPFRNDFLPVFENREHSVYREMISQLRDLGAAFAGLSGAGSTCFGVFTEKTQAEKAALSLRKTWGFAEAACPV